MATPKLSTSTVVQIPLAQLLPDPDQPRLNFDKNALQLLADNIKERGIQVPLLVRIRSTGKKNDILIKDGERRWRAAKLAKLKTVPVLLAHTGDAAQIRIDQVSVNNLRESLKPMELARTLVRMRDQDKLTANDMAARLAKQGMTMTQAHITNMMKLVDLPAWAQAMVDAEEIEASIAREIAGIADKAVFKPLEAKLKDFIDWRGKLTASDVQQAIRSAYDKTAIDLRATESYSSKPVLFDYKKICTSCTALRQFGGGAWCMDPKGFEKHQAEAKEAGLGPGGKKVSAPKAASKDKPLTPAQEKKLEAAKAEKRASSLEDKSKTYLHDWAIQKIVQFLPSDTNDTAQRLVEFAAACRPGIPGYEAGAQYQQIGKERGLRHVAARAGYPALPHFLAARDSGSALYLALASEIVKQLPLPETLLLAHHLFGNDIAPLWKVDAEYLDLLQKAELVQVAEKHAALPEGKKAWGGFKAPELVTAILAARDQVGVPPMLAKLYSQPEVRDPEDTDDDDDFDDNEEAGRGSEEE